jgi:hypothetical protein
MKLRMAAALAVLGCGAGVTYLATRGAGAHAPFFPQYRREVADGLYAAVAQATKLDPRGRELMIAPPTMPKPAQPPSVAAYQSALVAGADRPGALAFRADSDLYCEYNRAQVEDQARKEGLTVDQVKELTFFGFVALRTTQANKLEEAMGRPMTDAEHQRLDKLLADENAGFAKAMRAAVDRGASEDDRWAMIRAAEDHYRLQFAELFAIDADHFDQMLVPDPDESGGGSPIPPVGAAPPPEPAAPAPSDPPSDPPPAPPKPAPAGGLTPAGGAP